MHKQASRMPDCEKGTRNTSGLGGNMFPLLLVRTGGGRNTHMYMRVHTHTHATGRGGQRPACIAFLGKPGTCSITSIAAALMGVKGTERNWESSSRTIVLCRVLQQRPQVLSLVHPKNQGPG